MAAADPVRHLRRGRNFQEPHRRRCRLFTPHPVVLSLNPADATLMILTLGVSIITFSNGRTNLLQGAVHLVLFVAYMVLIFSP